MAILSPGPYDSLASHRARQHLEERGIMQRQLLAHPACTEARVSKDFLSLVLAGKRRPGRRPTDATRAAITAALQDHGLSVGLEDWDVGPRESLASQRARAFLSKRDIPAQRLLERPEVAGAGIAQGTLSQILNGKRKPGRRPTDTTRVAITAALCALGLNLNVDDWDHPPRRRRQVKAAT